MHPGHRSALERVFDVGNVLIHWDPKRLYSQLFNDPAKVRWFLETVCHSAWNLELDRGRARFGARVWRALSNPILAIDAQGRANWRSASGYSEHSKVEAEMRR
jgi:hypothetical protein